MNIFNEALNEALKMGRQDILAGDSSLEKVPFPRPKSVKHGLADPSSGDWGIMRAKNVPTPKYELRFAVRVRYM